MIRPADRPIVKMDEGEQPWIAVITVTRNDKEALMQTFASVQGQSYERIRHYVIDGASVDGSTDLIRCHLSHLSGFLSEPDSGVYDAMNKGLGLVIGDYVIFMNSGDVFHAFDTVEKIVPCLDADIVYGDNLIEYDWGHRVCFLGKAPESLPLGPICCHQATFCRLAPLKTQGFDTSLRIAADYDYLVWAHTAGLTFRHVPKVVARVTANGLSDLRQRDATLEMRCVLKERGLLTASLAWHWRLTLLRRQMFSSLRKVLPVNAYIALKSLKTWVTRSDG